MNDISEIFGGAFDTGSVPPSDGEFTPIPPGWYNSEISNAEIKPTKAGNGSLLHVEHTVEGGDHDGRKVFQRINLANPSAKAVEIGIRELATLGQACGITALQDSAELIGHKIQIKVKINPGDADFPPDNQITAAKPRDGQQPAPKAAPVREQAPATVQAPTQQAAPAPAGPKKMPWQR